MKKFLLVVIIALAIFFVYRRVNAPETSAPAPESPPSAPAEVPAATTPPSTSEPSASPVPPEPEQPAAAIPGDLGQDDVPIRISAPVFNGAVRSPLTIAGQTTLAVDTLFLELRNPTGIVLIAEPIRVRTGADGTRTFSLTIQYAFTTTKAGTVQVYAKDANTSRIVVPVTFE